MSRSKNAVVYVCVCDYEKEEGEEEEVEEEEPILNNLLLMPLLNNNNFQINIFYILV